MRKIIYYILTNSFLLASCTAQDRTGNPSYSSYIFSEAKEEEIEIVSESVIDESNEPFSSFIYQYSNHSDTIIINDRINCRILFFGKNGKLISKITNKTDLRYPFCPFGVTLNGDTTFLLNNENFNLMTQVNGDIVEITNLEFPDVEIIEMIQPISRTKNGKLLIAYGYDLMKNANESKQSITSNLNSYMATQNIFALYDKNWNLEKTFSFFPKDLFKEGVKYVPAKSYHYSISNDFIYLKFTLGKNVYKYNLEGELIEEIEIEIPDFDYSINDLKVNDSYLGFAADFVDGHEVFYFVTYTFSPKETTLYRFDRENGSLKKKKLESSQHYLMPNVSNKAIYFLRTYFPESEHKTIYEINFH